VLAGWNAAFFPCWNSSTKQEGRLPMGEAIGNAVAGSFAPGAALGGDSERSLAGREPVDGRARSGRMAKPPP